jgi:hypothetical protein
MAPTSAIIPVEPKDQEWHRRVGQPEGAIAQCLYPGGGHDGACGGSCSPRSHRDRPDRRPVPRPEKPPGTAKDSSIRSLLKYPNRARRRPRSSPEWDRIVPSCTDDVPLHVCQAVITATACRSVPNADVAREQVRGTRRQEVAVNPPAAASGQPLPIPQSRLTRTDESPCQEASRGWAFESDLWGRVP